MNRVCIYPKDIQTITGKSERWGRDVIRKIKKEFSKESHQLVTIEEFCNYMGFQKSDVEKMIV